MPEVTILTKHFNIAGGILSKAVEEDGKLYVSGPLHDLQEDYDKETMDKAGIFKGLTSFYQLGAHVDFEHMFNKSVARGKPDVKLLIGNEVKHADVEGLPNMTTKLHEWKELAQDIFKDVDKGVPYGYSIEGIVKANGRDPKNPQHILIPEIHMVTIAHSPKSFGPRLKPGMPATAMELAKALLFDLEHNDYEDWDSYTYFEKSGSKKSKESVDYREGSAGRNCSKCVYFHFTGDSGSCSKVNGKISPDDLCDIYKRRSNMEIDKHRSNMEKALPEASYTCPRCGKGMYCIHCHKANAAKSRVSGTPFSSTSKSMTTGDGIVQPGSSGGQTLRRQQLRGGAPEETSFGGRSCANCGRKFQGKGSLCSRCREAKNGAGEGAETGGVYKGASGLARLLKSKGFDNADAVADQFTKSYVGFNKLKQKIAASGARNPGAVAAAIGRRKYGKRKFQSAAAKGKKMRGIKPQEHQED